MKRLTILPVFICVLLIGATASAVTYSHTNIIDSTVAAPTGNYMNIGEAAISGNRVAFKASYDQGFLGIIDQIFTSTGGPRTLIVEELRDAPPRTGYELGGGTFSAFGRPAIDGSSVYFDAEVFHSDMFRYAYGVFHGQGVQFQGRPLVSTAVSQREAPQFIRQKNTADALVSNGYFSYRSSSANTSALDTIRLSNRERTLNTKIIGAGDNTPDGSRFSLIDPNYDLSGATVAFRGVFGTQEGIFTGAGGPLTTIVKKGDSTPSGDTLTSVLDPSISGSTVAFVGTFAGGSGIFMGNGASLSSVVRTGDATPAGNVFTGFSIPAIAFNTLAFRGDYAGGSGIYAKRGGELSKVVEIGDSLFGSTVASLQFSDLGLDAAGSGSLTFTYGLADGRSGVAMATLGAGLPTIFEDAQATVPVPGSVGIVWVPVPNFEGRNLTRAWLYSAELMSTNARNANLTNANLRGADLTNANLSGANLSNAVFASTTLNGANFTYATIRGTDFERTAVTVQNCQLFCSTTTTFFGGITPAQLASTASYRAGDLSDVKLTRNNLTNANFAGQKLERAVLHAATLTDANFNGADISGASFGRYSIVSGCYKAHWGACMTETTTFGTGISVPQLMATESYRNFDLANIDFSGNQLAGANLDVQNLTGASFYGADLTDATFRGANMANANFHAAQLAGANLQGADARGALFSQAVLTDAVIDNFIESDGRVSGIDIAAGEVMRIRDYDGDVERNLGPIAVTVDQSFMMSDGSTVRMLFEADAWDSTISFASGIPVALGGMLELAFADGVDVANQVGRTFDLFDWTGVSPTGDFDVVSPFLWDLSNLYTTGNVILTSLVAALPGDFNNNGSVDAADYVVWRKTGGAQAGYDAWRSNFGRTAGTGTIANNSAATAPVPEPTLCALAATGVLGLAGSARRQRARRRNSRNLC